MTIVTGREFSATTEELLVILLLEFPGSKDALPKIEVRFNRHHGTEVVYREV